MDNEVPRTEKIISECIQKLAQVIVLTRMFSEQTTTPSRSFNLVLPVSNRVREKVSAICDAPSNHSDLQIDVMLSAPTFPVPILLERWNIHTDSEAQLQSSKKFDPSNMYKRMIILVRAVYSCVHMLPAFQLFKTARATSDSHSFQIDCFFSPQGQRSELFDCAPTNFVFSSLALDHGKMHTSVFYRKDCAFEFPGTKPSLLNPSIIPNFFDSTSVAHSAPVIENTFSRNEGADVQRREREPQLGRGSSDILLPTSHMEQGEYGGRNSVSMSERRDSQAGVFSRSMLAEERKSISDDTAMFPVSRSQAISIPASPMIPSSAPPFASSFDSQNSLLGSVPSSFSRRMVLFNHSPDDQPSTPEVFPRHSSPRPFGILPPMKPPSFSLDSSPFESDAIVHARQLSLRNRIDKKPLQRVGQRILEEEADFGDSLEDPEAVLGDFISRMNTMSSLSHFVGPDGQPRRIALNSLFAEVKRLSKNVLET